VWVIAPVGAVNITLNFTFFYAYPDQVQTVSIDECHDVLCSQSTPLSGSPYLYLAESLSSQYESLPLVKTGFARVTYTSMWSGHTQARFVLSYSSGSKSWTTCSGLHPNAWHHVAGIIELVGSAVLARLYVNSSLVAATTTNKAAGYDLMLSGGGGMAVGRVHPMSAPFGHFSGLIDELSISNRSLSEDELLSAMTLPCRARPGTVACFSFDMDESFEGTAFLDTGSGQPSNAIPVVGDKFMSWCSTRDDAGNLLIQATRYYATVVPYGPSWGFCTDEILLPGLGFDYNADQLSSIGKNISNLGALGEWPGCVNLPLVVQGNIARRLVNLNFVYIMHTY
jgi:hypothetical protein